MKITFLSRSLFFVTILATKVKILVSKIMKFCLVLQVIMIKKLIFVYFMNVHTWHFWFIFKSFAYFILYILTKDDTYWKFEKCYLLIILNRTLSLVGSSLTKITKCLRLSKLRRMTWLNFRIFRWMIVVSLIWMFIYFLNDGHYTALVQYSVQEIRNTIF